MIIIPEIETVVLLVPRTGSGTLRHAIARRYPNSILLYRHMEADGIPFGYDRWRRIGVVRNPLERLWSLYRFIPTLSVKKHEPEYVRAMHESVSLPFDEWIVRNNVVFTSPHGVNKYHPKYSVNHALPETRKSQFHYLRPDLGTEVWRFTDLLRLAEELGVNVSIRENVTGAGSQVPSIGARATEHMLDYFAWDYEVTE